MSFSTCGRDDYHGMQPDPPSRDSHPVGGDEEDEYSSHFWQRMTEEERDDTLISIAMSGSSLNSDVGEDVERKLRKRLALLRSLRSSLATVSGKLVERDERIENLGRELRARGEILDGLQAKAGTTWWRGVGEVIDSLRSSLATVSKDKECMDYLEAHAWVVIEPDDMEWGSDIVIYRVSGINDRQYNEVGRGRTVREAIGAARQAPSPAVVESEPHDAE